MMINNNETRGEIDYCTVVFKFGNVNGVFNVMKMATNLFGKRNVGCNFMSLSC